VKLSPDCIAGIEASARTVREVIDQGRIIYGVNTGFGLLATTIIPTSELEHLQHSIVLSHAAGIGAYMDESTVRLIMVLKINSLARGFSGVRLELIKALLALLNAEVYPRPFDGKIHEVRGLQSQIDVAACYRQLLQHSEIEKSHQDCEAVQDPYSLRCQPQVMGACLEQIRNVSNTLAVEANGVSDNPLVFPDQMDIISGGNFHAEPVAMAADNLALALAEIGALSERRMALLIDTNMSKLPPFPWRIRLQSTACRHRPTRRTMSPWRHSPVGGSPIWPKTRQESSPLNCSRPARAWISDHL
jgi:histidine ammonia-lyase